MIEKQDFYHGAALARLVDDGRCLSIARHSFGYLINDELFVLIKYSTKGRSPWGFAFSEDDISRITKLSETKIFIAFVCGGDGVCVVPQTQILSLLQQKPGWISAKRLSNKAYAVSGPAGSLKHKVPMNRWPSILYLSEEIE